MLATEQWTQKTATQNVLRKFCTPRRERTRWRHWESRRSMPRTRVRRLFRVRYLCRGPACGPLPRGGATNHRDRPRALRLRGPRCVCFILMNMYRATWVFIIDGKRDIAGLLVPSIISSQIFVVVILQPSQAQIITIVSSGKKSNNQFIYSVRLEQQADLVHSQGLPGPSLLNLHWKKKKNISTLALGWEIVYRGCMHHLFLVIVLFLSDYHGKRTRDERLHADVNTVPTSSAIKVRI